MSLVTISGINCLRIIDRNYTFEDKGPEDECEFHLEYDGRDFVGRHADPGQAVLNLVDAVETYLRPIHQAELKKLDDWNEGRPIPGRVRAYPSKDAIAHG